MNASTTHRVFLCVPDNLHGVTQGDILAELATKPEWGPFTPAEVSAALRELKAAQKIAHPDADGPRHWVRTSGRCVVTRSKVYRSRFATGPGFAWSWLYHYTTPGCDRPVAYGTHLASLRDRLRRIYPRARQVEVWKAPTFRTCSHPECREDHLRTWIETGHDDPLCREIEAAEDIRVALCEAAEDRHHGR